MLMVIGSFNYQRDYSFCTLIERVERSMDLAHFVLVMCVIHGVLASCVRNFTFNNMTIFKCLTTWEVKLTLCIFIVYEQIKLSKHVSPGRNADPIDPLP